MDDLEFVDPVDVLSQLPKDFQTNLESKKWTERRDALQALLDLLEKHPKLEKKCQYGEIVEQLRKTLEKDANINVCALAAKCLRGIAHGLRQSFGPHALGVVPVIFEKFKEKKPVLKDPLVQCIDTIFLTTNMDNLIESICAAMEKTNPTIKKETDLFLSRCFMYYSASTMPKKALKAFAPLLVKHTSDSDQEVREASYNALGSAMRATGEKPISTLLAEISEDNMKMGKIREFSQKYMEEVGANGLNQSGSSSGGGGGGGAATNKAQEEVDDLRSSNAPAPSNHDSAASAPGAMKEVDPFDLIDPVDVLAKLPPDFQTNLESAKWTERRDALQALLDLLEKFPKLDPKVQYGEIMDSLKKILSKDSNINVCALAGKCTRGIAAGLRVKFAPHAISVVPIILDKFKEKKPALRDSMVACIDAVTASINLDQIEEKIVAAMENKNPSIKAQTDLFLARSFKNLNSQTMPKKMLKNVAAILVKHSCDSDPEVREASCGALGSAMRVIGEPAIMPLLSGVSEDKTKMDKIREQCQKMISEYGPAVTAAQEPPKAVAKKPVAPPKKPSMSRSSSVQSLNEENIGTCKLNTTRATTPHVVSKPPPIPTTIKKEGPLKDNTNIQHPVIETDVPCRYAIDEDFVELKGIHALESVKIMNEIEAYEPQVPSKPKMTRHSERIIINKKLPELELASSGSSNGDLGLDHIDSVINNISSALPNVALEAIGNVMCMLKEKDQQSLVLDRVSHIIKSIAAQLNLVIKVHTTKSESRYGLLNIILSCVHDLTSASTSLNIDEDAMTDWLFGAINVLSALTEESEEQMKKSYNITTIRIAQRVDITVFFCGSIRGLQKMLKIDNSQGIQLFVKCLYKWQDLVKKQPKALKLRPFISSANDFYENFAEEEQCFEIMKTIELCIQHAILIMGESIKGVIKTLKRPNMKMVSYCYVFLSQLHTDPSWKPKFEGTVEDELPVLELVDNLIHNLNSPEFYVKSIAECIEKNPSEYSRYEEYLKKCCLGSVVRNLVEHFLKNGSIPSVTNHFYVDMAQSAIAQQAKLEKYLKREMENGHGAPILQARDANQESFTSDIPVPENLANLSIRRTPGEKVIAPTPKAKPSSLTMRRRSMEKSVYSDIKNKLKEFSNA